MNGFQNVANAEKCTFLSKKAVSSITEYLEAAKKLFLKKAFSSFFTDKIKGPFSGKSAFSSGKKAISNRRKKVDVVKERPLYSRQFIRAVMTDLSLSWQRNPSRRYHDAIDKNFCLTARPEQYTEKREDSASRKK